MKGPLIGQRGPLTRAQRTALAKRNSRMWASGYFHDRTLHRGLPYRLRAKLFDVGRVQ